MDRCLCLLAWRSRREEEQRRRIKAEAEEVAKLKQQLREEEIIPEELALALSHLGLHHLAVGKSGPALRYLRRKGATNICIT